MRDDTKARLGANEAVFRQINEGIETTVALIRSHAQEKELTILTDLDGDLPCVTCYPAHSK